MQYAERRHLRVMKIPLLDTLGEKFSWAQFLFKEAVLHKTLGQVWKFLKQRQKMLDIFKMYFSISLVLGPGTNNRGSLKITKIIIYLRV